MKAAVKAAWVKDLRENPGAQGIKLLDYIDPADGKRKQCCLGRLCLLAVEAGVIPAPELHDDGVYFYLDGSGGYEAFDQDTLLPRKVQEWAGLTGDDIEISGGAGPSASCANDVYRYTFADIADEAD